MDIKRQVGVGEPPSRLPCICLPSSHTVPFRSTTSKWNIIWVSVVFYHGGSEMLTVQWLFDYLFAAPSKICWTEKPKKLRKDINPTRHHQTARSKTCDYLFAGLSFLLTFKFSFFLYSASINLLYPSIDKKYGVILTTVEEQVKQRGHRITEVGLGEFPVEEVDAGN